MAGKTQRNTAAVLASVGLVLAALAVLLTAVGMMTSRQEPDKPEMAQDVVTPSGRSGAFAVPLRASIAPSAQPSQEPSTQPSTMPTISSDAPSSSPSAAPTDSPTPEPTPGPTRKPTQSPTGSPTTAAPTGTPRKYAVYFDPEVEPDRNPKGPGWVPVGPENWDEVNRRAYQSDLHNDFMDWSDLSEASIDYEEGNQCEDRSLSQRDDLEISSSSHRQSPTIMRDMRTCTDKHGFYEEEHGGCLTEHVTFETTPYALRATFEDCGASLDMSMNPDRWVFKMLEAKSPSEHVELIKDNKYKRYDGELHLYHYGKMKKSKDVIMIVAVLLDADEDNEKDKELEKYIDAWEEMQEQQYRECDVKFNDDSCSLGPRFPGFASNGTRMLLDRGDSNALLRKVTGRRLDDDEDESSSEDLKRDYDPYELWDDTDSEAYWNYEGSLTHPPCSEQVEWRVMRYPLQVSKRQMRRIDNLLARHIDLETCSLATAGDYRRDGTCHVDVNRPLMYSARGQSVADCVEWYVKEPEVSTSIQTGGFSP